MKKKIMSLLMAMSMGISSGSAVFAAEHQTGKHDFGDPFAPYLNTKLVMKAQIEEAKTISHTSKNVQGSPAVTADIVESSAQFYTRDNGDGDLADGSLESRDYGNVKNVMFAYMYEPATAGKYPAILFLHGGGGTADTMKERAKDFAAKGYVTMAIDIPALYGTVGNVTVGGAEEKRSSGKYIGNDNYRFNITEAEGGAKNSNLVDAEVGVIQAFNYLAGNSKVDTEKMGIMGSSWGGYSTTFASGILGDKVKAAYSQYGSGFYGPTPDGKNFGSFWTVKGFYPTDAYAIQEWYSYLDPSAYLDNIKANYYMDAAAKDTFFWPANVEATLDKALNEGDAASANHVWSYNSSHESISGTDTLYPFMDYYLKGEGTPISKTEIVKTELKTDGSNEVYIKVTAEAEPASVKLVYSKNDVGYTSRTWNTINAVKDGDVYMATIPSEIVAEGIEYYALTKDGDKAAYSSSRIKAGFTQKVSVTGTPVFTLNDDLSNVIGNGKFTAKIPVINNDYAQPSSVRAIMAIYKDDVLEKTVLSETESLSAGVKDVIEVSSEISASDISKYSVKIMLWDGAETMEPYGRAYSLASVDAPPSAPTNLKVTESSFNGITMTWNSSSDNIAVEGYNVYKKKTGDSEYEKIATLSGNAVSYTDTMIEVNETYDYRVSAFDASKNNSEAAEVQADSIEGAKVELNQFDPENGITIEGYKLSAHIGKNTDNGSAVTLKKNFKPLQDEVTRDCLEIVNGTGTGTGKYIELKVDDDYINPELDNKVAVMVTFNDVNFDKINMQYNAADGNKYKPGTIHNKLNEQTWMTKTYIIDDAAFNNAQAGGYDLRLNFDLGTTNYISMIQIVNLSEDFAAVSSGADSIDFAWKSVAGAESYEIYRDGVLVAQPKANERTYTDEGLTIDTEYTYTFNAVLANEVREIKTITASTLKRYIAEVDFNAETEENMKATTSGFTAETVDGLKAMTTESADSSLKFSVDKTVASAKRDYLVTIKYNDCGNALPIRVGMVNSPIDRAHYFYTNGSGKWETATVLMPAYQFNNNGEDLQIKTTANGAKYAISDVQLSVCPSYDDGAKYVSGIVSGVTAKDGMLNTSLTTFRRGNDKSGAEIAEYEGEQVIKLNSTDINGSGQKRAEFNIVPDYRWLGQDYSNAVLPGADGFDKTPAAVRPITIKITYLKNNTSGAIYVKGAKLDEESNTIKNPDNDGSLNLVGSGEWVTTKIHIDDYYVQGSSMATNSPIKLIASGVPENEDIIIGKIEITSRDYSTKVGEYSVADPTSAVGISATFDDGIVEKTVDGKSAMYVDTKDTFFRFAVDKDVVSGVKDRLVTITYHDGGIKNMPIRISMVNNTINGAHYIYTNGTNRWETATVLIPQAEFKGNDNDITIKLIRDDQSLAIAKLELADGCEHETPADDIGARNVTGIASGMTTYNKQFNTSLATWATDNYTTVEPVTVGGVEAFKLVSSHSNSRAEIRINPDYRFLGQTDTKVKYPAEESELPEGAVRPVTVRVTYYKGSGFMFVKAPTLKEDGSGVEWTTNHASFDLSKGDGEWVTAEADIDDFYVNGGADVFKTYIQFITNGAKDGAIIKSIEIVNR